MNLGFFFIFLDEASQMAVNTFYSKKKVNLLALLSTLILLI